jgi:hypothetical protein
MVQRCDAVSRRIPVTGPMLQTKASEFAKQLNVDTFKASKGWLQSFNTRNNISFGTMSGERGDVKEQTVSDWKKNFPIYVKVMRKKTFSIWMNLGFFLKTPFAKHYIFNLKTVQVARHPKIA